MSKYFHDFATEIPVYVTVILILCSTVLFFLSIFLNAWFCAGWFAFMVVAQFWILDTAIDHINNFIFDKV